MAEDIQEALLEYQVGGGVYHRVVVYLKFGRFRRRPSSGRYMTIVAD